MIDNTFTGKEWIAIGAVFAGTVFLILLSVTLMR